MGQASALLPKRIVFRCFLAKHLLALDSDNVVGVRDRKDGLAICASGKGLRRQDDRRLRTQPPQISRGVNYRAFAICLRAPLQAANQQRSLMGGLSHFREREGHTGKRK